MTQHSDGSISKIIYGNLRASLLVSFICILLNVAGYIISQQFNNLLYLDMTGTCLGAMLMGPWYGAFIGAITNFILDIWFDGFIDYGIVNIFGGVVIGLLFTKLRKQKFQSTQYSKLFWWVLFSGAILGVVCAVLALLVRFGYNLKIDPFYRQEIINGYNTGKLTSPNDIMTAKIFIDGLITDGDSIFKLLILDFLIIIPDKLFSVSVSLCLIMFFIPRLGKMNDKINNLYILKYSALLLGSLFWLFLLLVLLFWEHQMLNFTKEIDSTVLCVWLVPLIIGIVVSIVLSPKIIKMKLTDIAPSKNPIKNHETYIPHTRMYSVYQDSVQFTLGFAALIMTLKLPYLSDQYELAVQEGLGLLTFFVVAMIIPNIIRKYL